MQNTRARWPSAERGRGAPGVDAAHAARQGNRRDDRGRSALRARGRPSTSHHSGPTSRSFRHAYHVFKNGWEDKNYIEARVYGMDKVKEEIMTKWTPDKVESAASPGAGLQDRRDDGQNSHRQEVGAWARRSAPSAAVVRASCILQPRSATSAFRRRHQHLTRPRQRAGRHRRRTQPGFAAGVLRPATGSWKHGQRCGRRLRVDQAIRVAGDDGEVGHDRVALDRRRAREERPHRPGPNLRALVY